MIRRGQLKAPGIIGSKVDDCRGCRVCAHIFTTALYLVPVLSPRETLGEAKKSLAAHREKYFNKPNLLWVWYGGGFFALCLCNKRWPKGI